jgi:hypothetical protein
MRSDVPRLRASADHGEGAIIVVRESVSRSADVLIWRGEAASVGRR